LKMLTFFRLQLTSIIATLGDFIITVFLTETIGLYYVTSNASGAVSGGIINFLLNRKWVFKITGNEKLTVQITKYIIIWIASILLNTLGVFLITEFLAIKYFVSKIIVSVLVGILFNQTLQKQYVFK
jgi:putative flippase GtrA